MTAVLLGMAGQDEFGVDAEEGAQPGEVETSAWKAPMKRSFSSMGERSLQDMATSRRPCRLQECCPTARTILLSINPDCTDSPANSSLEPWETARIFD